jgi:hypothetical protein
MIGEYFFVYKNKTDRKIHFVEGIFQRGGENGQISGNDGGQLLSVVLLCNCCPMKWPKLDCKWLLRIWLHFFVRIMEENCWQYIGLCDCEWMLGASLLLEDRIPSSVLQREGMDRRISVVGTSSSVLNTLGIFFIECWSYLVISIKSPADLFGQFALFCSLPHVVAMVRVISSLSSVGVR